MPLFIQFSKVVFVRFEEVFADRKPTARAYPTYFFECGSISVPKIDKALHSRSTSGHMWDSNPRHPACKASVLPTELMAHFKCSEFPAIFLESRHCNIVDSCQCSFRLIVRGISGLQRLFRVSIQRCRKFPPNDLNSRNSEGEKMGLEPTTICLQSRRSTIELRPQQLIVDDHYLKIPFRGAMGSVFRCFVWLLTAPHVFRIAFLLDSVAKKRIFLVIDKVCKGGLEPPTFSVSERRSNQLNYSHINGSRVRTTFYPTSYLGIIHEH